MQMLFKLLRSAGELLPRSVVNGKPWTIAHLESESGGRLVLRGLATNPSSLTIAELYGARIKRADAEHITLLGIEQHGSAAVIQEWLLKTPPHLGAAGLQSPAAAGIAGWGRIAN